MQTRQRHDLWALVVAGFLVASSALLAWPGLDGLVPGGILTQARRNTEGLVFAALAITLISACNHRSKGPRWIWSIVAMAGLVATEVAPNGLALPAWIATLNEAIIGAVVLAVYLLGHWRRPTPWFYVGILLVVLAGEIPISGWESSGGPTWIVEKAEAWGFAALAGFFFDFVRPAEVAVPRLVVPSRRTVPRWAWYGALVIVPVALSALNTNGVDSGAAVGVVESALVWVQRITEGFVAALLITIFYDLRAFAARP